jgi:hypothetical protein
MELLNQANLLFAVAAPIVMIFAINAALLRADRRRPLFEAPSPRVPAPVAFQRAPAKLVAANDAQHLRAA